MKIVKNIISYFPSNFKLVGTEHNEFRSFGNIEQNQETDIIWVRKENKKELEEIIKAVRSKIIICKDIPNLTSPPDKTLILVENPQVFFLRLVKNMHSTKIQGKIAKTAIISPEAILGENVFIDNFVIVGKCIIGDNSSIKANTIIHDNVEIGKNVLISEFCNIGGQGFGHIRNEQGKFENMLHIGKVIIEDDVEIFPYTNVDKGTITETRICNGSKIDHYCHIGHNTYVGKNTLIAANSTLAGGAKVLDNVFLGINTNVKDGCIVNDNSFTGMGAVVIKSIPEGEIWAGVPAKAINNK